MATITGAMLRHTEVKTVGLCHSVQVCAETLFEKVICQPTTCNFISRVLITWPGCWTFAVTARICTRKSSAGPAPAGKHDDMVRHEIMKTFGYYVTESSEHNAEYMPYWIKRSYPELIERFNIQLDEYPRRVLNRLTNGSSRKWR